MINVMHEGLQTNKSMNMQFRSEITCEKPVYDNKIEQHTLHVPNKCVHTTVKSNIKVMIDKTIADLASAYIFYTHNFRA